MRCRIVALVCLLIGIAALVAVWTTLGFLPGVSVVVGLALVLWAMSRISPVATRGIFRGALDRFAGPMKHALVEVHSVRCVDESPRLAEDLARVDQWLQEIIEEDGANGLWFDAREAFYEEGSAGMMQETCAIDLTITPPEPETSWSPHALGLRPVAEPTAGGCEIVEIRLSPGPEDQLSLFEPQTAFEEVSGSRRIQLTVLLNARYREYTLEYLHADLWDTTIQIPPPPQGSYLRRFTAGVIERLTSYPKLTRISLGGLPVTDADVSRLAALQKLEGLDLAGSAISEACVADLASMTSLKDLVVPGRQLSTEAIRALQESLPDAEIRSEQVHPVG